MQSDLLNFFYISAVKLFLLFKYFIFVVAVFLFYERQIMVVDLQLLRTLWKRVGSWGRSSENVFNGMTKGLQSLTRGSPGSLSCPSQPALAHVYAIEDPFSELLQLIGGILDSFCRLPSLKCWISAWRWALPFFSFSDLSEASSTSSPVGPL